MSDSDTYKIRHIEVDFVNHQIFSNKIPLKLDLKAFQTLKLLIENKDKTVSIDQFMDFVWADKPSSPEVVASAIARIRKLLKKAGISDEIIMTAHKVGYSLNSKNINKPASNLEQNNNQKQAKPLLLWLLLAGLLTSLGFHYWQWENANNYQNVVIDKNQSNFTTSKSQGTTQIFFLRHAEKAEDETDDPALTEEGIRHANYWKRVLQHIKFDKVYTTEFIRNIQTAEILSSESNKEIIFYSPLSFEITEFINNVKGQKILIVGHSNTIPDMVNRLIGETEYPPMSHKNYNQIYQVNIDEQGKVSSSLLHVENPD